MAAISSNAVTKTWIAQAADAWVGGVAPTEGDTATIVNGAVIEIDGNITCGDDSATAAIQVASGGILHVPSTVAGSYALTCKGDFKVAGTFRIGTVANPIPVGTTFTLKLNYSATLSDGEFGLLIEAGGTFTCQGSDCWSNGLTDPDRCLLATDEAVNSTVWTTDGATAWDANDYIAIAPTGTTYSQYEIGQVDSVVGTTLNVKSFGGAGGGLAYAHTGTDADVRAEIINLTRNVVIMNYDGVIGTPGAVSYVSFATTAVVDVDWTEFRYMGENAAGKYGVVINTTSGSCNLNRCSFHHFEDGGIDVSSASADNFTIQNNVIYKLATVTGTRGAIYVENITTTGWTVTNCWSIAGVPWAYGNIQIKSLTGTISYLRSSGCQGNGIWLNTIGGIYAGITSYLVGHSNGGAGILCQTNKSTLSNITSWHNVGGIYFAFSVNTTVNTMDLYGNTNNIGFTSGSADGGNVGIVITGLKTSSTATRSSYGIKTSPYGYIGSTVIGAKLFSPVFSYVAGVRTANTYDIFCNASYAEIFLISPNFGGSSGNIRFDTGTSVGTKIYCINYDTTAGDQRTYVNQMLTANNGSIIQTDTAYYHTAAPSCKMTPTSATYKLDSGVMQIPVASGANPTVSVYLRKSAAYNGNQPRLIVKRNDALGITADTVMATFAGAVDVDVAPGTFTVLSGQPGAVTADGVIECYVDCDGTAGYINLDNWAVTGNT